MASSQRPLSPFMLGSHYRLQLTSVLSFLHRLSGTLLAVAAFALTWWLIAIASGPQALADFTSCANGILGSLFLIATVLCVCYHFFNGLRHLFWDTARGLDLKSAYASGWTVVVLSLLSSALVCALAFGLIGGAA